MLSDKFAFLGSTRFWAMVIGLVMVYLEAKGWIGELEAKLIEGLMAGFITVRTVDRAFEKSGSVDTGKTPMPNQPIEHF